LGWGLVAGAVNAGALFAATHDTLEAPGALVLGVAQAAAADAVALWLVLTACGLILGLAAVAARGRLRLLDHQLLYSALAVGVIAFTLVARMWLAQDPTSTAVWVGSAIAGTAVAAALVAVARLAPRLNRLAQARMGMVGIIPLAAAGSWAAGYIRWGSLPAAAWGRGVAAGIGVIAALAAGVICSAAARRLRHRRSRLPHSILRWAALIAPAAALTAAAAIAAPLARSRPPVILITIDTLRADRLGCYGSRAALTPNLDQLARGAIVFEHAFACAPWTANSLACMLTGRGVREIGLAPGVSASQRPTPPVDYLDLGVKRVPPMLPGMLRAAGYTTAAAITNPFLDARFGWGQGFDCFRNEQAAPPEQHWLKPILPLPLLGWRCASLIGWYLSRPYTRPANMRIYAEGMSPNARAQRLTRDAMQWLGNHMSDRAPFFLWVHYIDPHEPYASPHPPRGALETLKKAATPIYCLVRYACAPSRTASAICIISSVPSLFFIKIGRASCRERV
jgi:hypothetical protein